MVHYDDRLNVLASQKCEEGCRESLKSLANYYSSKAMYSHTLSFYQEAQERGHIRDINLTIVMIKGGVLFFEMTPQKAEKLIFKATSKVKKASPPSTLVRMVEKRIRKIHEYVESFRQQGGGELQVMLDSIPDFKTIQSIRSFLSKTCHNTSPSSTYFEMRHFSRILLDLEKNVFNKQELTDQHISDAMDLVISSQVMEH